MRRSFRSVLFTFSKPYDQALLWTAILSYVGYKVSWNLLRLYLISETTVLGDIWRLGKAPPAQKITEPLLLLEAAHAAEEGHCFGLSGYVPSRILTDYFEKTVLIDPDTSVKPIGRNYFGDPKLKRRDQISGSIEGLLSRVPTLKLHPTKRQFVRVPPQKLRRRIQVQYHAHFLWIALADPQSVPSYCRKPARNGGVMTYCCTSFPLSHETQEKVSRALPQDDRSLGGGIPALSSAQFRQHPKLAETFSLIGESSGWNIDTCPGTLAQYIKTVRELYNKIIPEERHDQDEWLFELLRLLEKVQTTLTRPLNGISTP
ncbi:uncharacterized protein EI90DRAFT_3020286 [Cantharellus anzutake]|uniref:uncharacterized protein n=1 Tax=Cantharellus anzutake TaxID=1750568 RepID=UPI0019062F7B|nr:uncharacterized protein EI90DRAFT_3020286 [Cantharellus anzutake]KAF8321389.1 hypothetical protein EI90DRAFT_3020286 [Cantharellus anzutake]